MLCTLYSGEKFPLKKEKKKNISRLFLSGKQRIPPPPHHPNEMFLSFFVCFQSPRKLEKIFSAKENDGENNGNRTSEKKKLTAFRSESFPLVRLLLILSSFGNDKSVNLSRYPKRKVTMLFRPRAQLFSSRFSFLVFVL